MISTKPFSPTFLILQERSFGKYTSITRRLGFGFHSISRKSRQICSFSLSLPPAFRDSPYCTYVGRELTYIELNSPRPKTQSNPRIGKKKKIQYCENVRSSQTGMKRSMSTGAVVRNCFNRNTRALSLSVSVSLSLPHRTRAQNSPTVVLVNENCFEERKNVLEVINRWYDLIRHRILNNRLMRIIHLQASKQASAHAHSFLPFLDNNKSVLESESKL